MKMSRILVVSLGVLLAAAMSARADYTAKNASGSTFTFKGFTCETTKQCPVVVPIDSTGAELFASGNAGYVRFPSAQAVTVSSGTVTTVSTVTSLSQFGGNAINLGAGSVGTGTLRITQASDSPEVAVLGATSDSAATAGGTGSLSAKLRLMTTQMDTLISSVQGPIPAGTADIGKVDPSTAANWGVVATGAAPPSKGVYHVALGSGATGGLARGLITCDGYKKYDASDNGSIKIVDKVASRKIYICGYLVTTGGSATNLKLVEGDGTNCATNAADVTPAHKLAANDKAGFHGAFWSGLVTATANLDLCINASAGNAHTAEVWYTIL